LGDALIWESLLAFLKSAPKKSSLIFVARDQSAWGKDGFNPWLEKELKDDTNVSISLTSALADIDLLTKEEQKRLRDVEREELKNNAVSSFVNSRSFISAGLNCQGLVQYKDILTEDDYRKIIEASTSNLEIYQSFFTSGPLNTLCSGEGDFVIDYLEKISKEIWDKFTLMNGIHLKRQMDGVDAFNLDDVPW
jgi:hypothetical protein